MISLALEKEYQRGQDQFSTLRWPDHCYEDRRDVWLLTGRNIEEVVRELRRKSRMCCRRPEGPIKRSTVQSERGVARFLKMGGFLLISF